MQAQFIRRYAGTSSTWSMSRIWNNLKKGLGAKQPPPMMEQSKKVIPEKSAPSFLKQLTKEHTATPNNSSSPAFLWKPSSKKYSDSEIARFEVETPMFRCSPQKLNDIGRQLSGLPLDAAVIQAKFSSKRAAQMVYQVLCQAQADAKLRGKLPSDYVIKEAVTGRGAYLKRLDIKGRGRCGIIRKPHAFIRFVLAIPDAKKEIGKLLKVKYFQRFEKPAYIKLDY